MGRIALVAAVALVAAGCGSGSHVSGRAVFARSCSGCHTATGRDTNVDGGDLSVGKLTVSEVESFGAIMPVHPKPTKAELHAVALYVVSREPGR
jgi:mono/diheme cytochrome c family protein